MSPRQADALAAAADALRLAADAIDAAAQAARRDERHGEDSIPGFLTLAEAAEAFGLSRSGLHAAIRRHEIPSRTIGRRRFVPREALTMPGPRAILGAGLKADDDAAADDPP